MTTLQPTSSRFNTLQMNAALSIRRSNVVRHPIRQTGVTHNTTSCHDNSSANSCERDCNANNTSNVNTTDNNVNSQQQNTQNLYRPIKFVGKGAFGAVYVARSPKDNSLVAVKRVLHDPRFKNRELDILKLLNHSNCISLKCAFKTHNNNNSSDNSSGDNITSTKTNNISPKKGKEVFYNIVMDYLPISLHQYNVSFRATKIYPPIMMVKLFSYQLFSGLNYIHSLGITHRDIKPQNIIVDPETCELKICDFGSAKKLNTNESSVSYIASRFYRAPELLYDCCYYTNAIDIWAAGCVIAESIMAGSPLFSSNNSEGQLWEIVKIIGRPNSEDLDSFPHNKNDSDFDFMNPMVTPSEATTSLAAVLPKHVPADLVELLKMIFVFNPTKRPTALECLKHRCFDDLFIEGIHLPNGINLPNLERYTDRL